MPIKSERYKKIEAELNDLQQWLKLGLVPKRDLVKHQHEIDVLQQKLEEEKNRVQLMRENGDVEDFVVPRRNNKGAYSEAPTMGDIDLTNDAEDATDVSTDFDGDSMTLSTSLNDDSEDDFSEDITLTGYTEELTDARPPKRRKKSGDDITEDEDPFSDRNRWRRGMVESDMDEW